MTKTPSISVIEFQLADLKSLIQSQGFQTEGFPIGRIYFPFSEEEPSFEPELEGQFYEVSLLGCEVICEGWLFKLGLTEDLIPYYLCETTPTLFVPRTFEQKLITQSLSFTMKDAPCLMGILLNQSPAKVNELVAS